MFIKTWDLTASFATDEDEILLARRCGRGDEKAMRRVFEAHEPRLRALAYRMLGNVQDAEDISAATFIRFWRSAESFRGECSLKSFLTRISLNLIRDCIRKKPAPELPLPIERPAHDEELMERIDHALLLMDPDERALLALYYLEDSSYEELCEALGITYDVLRTRLVRARKRLRKLVGVDDE